MTRRRYLSSRSDKVIGCTVRKYCTYSIRHVDECNRQGSRFRDVAFFVVAEALQQTSLSKLDVHHPDATIIVPRVCMISVNSIYAVTTTVLL